MTLTINQIATCVSGQPVNISNDQQIIENITTDSRKIKSAGLFCAIRGIKTDGHQYLSQVYNNGAFVSITELPELVGDKPAIIVKDSREAWSKLCACWFDNPEKKMTVCGVTGTNGKSTVHWLLGQALDKLMGKTLRLGTLGCYLGNDFLEESLTTSDSWDISRLLRLGLDRGAKAVSMEVSSHGLDQQRVAGLDFNVAIFTNLTRDHLDYHGDMESYFLAKLKLFEQLAVSSKSQKGAIVNCDDAYGKRIIEYLNAKNIKVLTYGQKKLGIADYAINQVSLSHLGTEVELEINRTAIKLKTKLVGLHNVYNLLSVWGTLAILGYSDSQIVEVIPELEAVPGRLESVGNEGLGVYVDYAHTPDALVNVLMALKPICQGNLWVVFGCGGDRDRGKRPIMGEVAARLADRVVVTSDNPRTENPDDIIAEILSSGVKPDFAIADRKVAIEKVLSMARVNDVILIAGKGHEDYQIVGTTKYPFSDQLIVKEFLSKN